MKKSFTLLIASALALTACSKVPAGNVGVKAYLLGGGKGVDSEVLGPGRYWIGWNEELYIFPTFTQTVTWNASEESGDRRFVFQDVDGLKIVAPVGLTYSVDKHKVSILFQKYRRGIDEITDVFLKNNIRDALVIEAATMKVDDIYGRGKEALISRVTERVRKQVSKDGINIEKLYWAGDMALPDPVVAALNQKIQATQQAQKVENQLRETEAEARKKIAAAEGEAQSIKLKAEAEAQANREIAASLSPALIEYEKIKKWQGQVPQVSGGATPIIDLRN